MFKADSAPKIAPDASEAEEMRQIYVLERKFGLAIHGDGLPADYVTSDARGPSWPAPAAPYLSTLRGHPRPLEGAHAPRCLPDRVHAHVSICWVGAD